VHRFSIFSNVQKSLGELSFSQIVKHGSVPVLTMWQIGRILPGAEKNMTAARKCHYSVMIHQLVLIVVDFVSERKNLMSVVLIVRQYGREVEHKFATLQEAVEDALWQINHGEGFPDRIYSEAKQIWEIPVKDLPGHVEPRNWVISKSLQDLLEGEKSVNDRALHLGDCWYDAPIKEVHVEKSEIQIMTEKLQEIIEQTDRVFRSCWKDPKTHSMPLNQPVLVWLGDTSYAVAVQQSHCLVIGNLVSITNPVILWIELPELPESYLQR
jgi:hypothetical protein